jgi:hypothetical protein
MADTYRCNVNGRSVIQSEPCFEEAAMGGRFRCFVDGQVIYSAASCSTIKSKDTLAKEAKEAEAADIAKKKAAAKRLEAADRSNFAMRILRAEQATVRNLRDPDSARFNSSFVSWFSGYAVVCGLVSGRNGFGGYAQAVRYYAIDDYVVIDDGKAYKNFDQHWLDSCGPN